MSIAKALARLIERNSIGVNRLSRKTGINNSTLSLIASGGRSANFLHCVILEDFFNLERGELGILLYNEKMNEAVKKIKL